MSTFILCVNQLAYDAINRNGNLMKVGLCMKKNRMILIGSSFVFSTTFVILILVGGNSGIQTSMLEAVEARSKEVYVAPIDARIDRVWKAIPGLDGRMLDKQKTINASQKKWSNSGELIEIYRSLKPLSTLATLPPAPIYRANPDKKMVSFMINVAWGNEHIPKILHTLRKERVKATFFLDGSWLSKNSELALQILHEGHELSNHGYSHKNMSKLSREQATSEILRTEQLLKKLGVKNHLFAPPSGDFDDETVEIARKHGLFTVLWTIDTVDWRRPPAKQLIQKVRAELTPGALILMHPTTSTRDALPELIKTVRGEGLELNTVSKTISSNRFDFVE
jgi:probable sporulation protein (polysaccharide deacetylase family)